MSFTTPSGDRAGRQASLSEPRAHAEPRARGGPLGQLVWLAVAIALVSGVLLALGLFQLRSQAIRAGERLNETLAQVVQEQTSRTFQTIDLKLQLAAVGLARLEAAGELNEGSASALMRNQLQDLPYVRALRVLDAQGRERYATDPGNVGTDFSDRAYFQIHQSHSQSGFQVSPPVRSRTTGAWLISASRPMRSAGGALTGVIVAAVEPPYFDRLWSSVSAARGSSVSLLHRDGVLMVRSPYDELGMGTGPANMRNVPQLLAASGDGQFVGNCESDSQECLFSLRRLSVPSDMVVVVGSSIDRLLGPFRQLAIVSTIIWALSSTAVLLLCGFLGRAWRQSLRSEQRLQQMSQRFSLATDSAEIGIWDWNLKTDQWSATPTYFSILGLPPREGGQPSARNLDHVHPDDRAVIAAKMQSALSATDAASFAYEARERHADGSYRWLSLIGRVLAHDALGKPSRLLGVRMDITDRKNTELALQHAKGFAEKLIENANAMVVGIDRQGKVTLFNQAAQRITGFTADDVLGKSALDMLGMPNRFPPAPDGSRRALDGIGARFHDGIIVTRSGARRQISWQNSAIMEDGKIVGILSFGIDETERNLAEAALRASEERFRQLAENTREVFWLQDPVNREMLYVSVAYQVVWGRSCDSLYADPQTWFDSMHPEDRPRVSDRLLELQMCGEYDEEYRIVRPDGSIRWIRDRAFPVRDAQGNVYRMSGVADDITERRQALLALSESEERYRLLVEKSPYAIGVHQDGQLIMANPAVLALFGAEHEAQLIGRSVNTLLHPDDVQAANELTMRMFAGETGIFPAEVRYRRLDGSIVDVEVSAAPLIYQGRPALQIISLDISQRKKAEAALHESTRQLQTLSRRVLEAQETERRRVARELHDELGQSLTSLKISIQTQQRFGQELTNESLSEYVAMVDDALRQVRRLALALRPSMLDDLGLLPALRWMVEQTATRLAVPINFRHALPGQVRLAADVETACFRIAQEAFTNIARYARAQQVEVELGRDADQLVLTIRDDGVGFDLAAARTRAIAGGSLGVLGMQERAMLIGGTLEIRTGLGEGCSVQLRCPWRVSAAS